MANVERFERLRALSPIDAIHAWLNGEFGIDDEAALTEAIRRDPRVTLSDEEITDVMCDCLDGGIDASACLDRLAGMKRRNPFA